jgi:hypothetical protein
MYQTQHLTQLGPFTLHIQGHISLGVCAEQLHKAAISCVVSHCLSVCLSVCTEKRSSRQTNFRVTFVTFTEKKMQQIPIMFKIRLKQQTFLINARVPFDTWPLLIYKIQCFCETYAEAEENIFVSETDHVFCDVRAENK